VQRRLRERKEKEKETEEEEEEEEKEKELEEKKNNKEVNNTQTQNREWARCIHVILPKRYFRCVRNLFVILKRIVHHASACIS
jgi:hypothetical protein